jgi:hypothetical protein
MDSRHEGRRSSREAEEVAMTTIDTRSARTGRWLLPSAVAAGVAALLATLIIAAVAWLAFAG